MGRFAHSREAVPEGKSKNGALKMSKATLIATLMAVVSAFSSPAKAQAPLKTKPAAKSDQPTYMITAHKVVHDDSTNSQLDNYTIVYESELLKVQYAESQISTVNPGAPLLEQLAPGKGLHLHFRYGVRPQEPDVSQVPQVGVAIRACETDPKYPDSGHALIAIQSVSAPCMARTADGTLHYILAPNAGLKDLGYVNFDILEATNNVGVAAAQSAPPRDDPYASIATPILAQPSAQSAPPRRDIPAIAKAANGAIVSIVMSDKDSHAIAQGSGFLISNDGVILTNYHVIAEGSSAVVKLPDGTLYVVDGVLASDKVRDVAVIKAHGENFRTLTLGDSDQLQVGEEVVAIGNPLSLESTVSNGIVSGLRTVEDKGGKFLQVTTPISPGSSGGPLFNVAGEVVGITTMYLAGGENLNFAIPINDAKRMLLDKSTTIQALPNEPEPVKAQTPSSIATPVHATAEQCAVDELAWRLKYPDANQIKLPYVDVMAFDQEIAGCIVMGARDESTARTNLRYVVLQNLLETVAMWRLIVYIAGHNGSNPWPEDVPFFGTLGKSARPPPQKRCEADARVWSQQSQAGMFDRSSTNDIQVHMAEMLDCTRGIVGTDFLAVATDLDYFSVAGIFRAMMIYRIRAYMARNNEWNQFMSEDAAGQR
jgi:S1-C subfamily serine protease